MLCFHDPTDVGVGTIVEDPVLEIITVAAAYSCDGSVGGQDMESTELAGPLRGLLRLVPADDDSFFC